VKKPDHKPGALRIQVIHDTVLRPVDVTFSLVIAPQSPGPFACVLVPYDGSEPSQAALTLALDILSESTRLVIITVIDETPVISQSATTMLAYDPTPLFEALD
jgi:hypothetical protein